MGYYSDMRHFVFLIKSVGNPKKLRKVATLGVASFSPQPYCRFTCKLPFVQQGCNSGRMYIPIQDIGFYLKILIDQSGKTCSKARISTMRCQNDLHGCVDP